MPDKVDVTVAFDNLVERKLHFSDSVAPCIEVGDVLIVDVKVRSNFFLSHIAIDASFGFLAKGKHRETTHSVLEETLYEGNMNARFLFEKRLEIPIPEEGPVTFRGEFITIDWEWKLDVTKHFATLGKHTAEITVIPKTI